MNTLIGRWTLLAAVAACGSLPSACYVVADVPPPAYVEGYQPSYYDGYVVYYDDVGRPFYHVNGAVVWVSPASREYAGLMAHWRVYGPAYHTWYAHYGYRYRGYRGARR